MSVGVPPHERAAKEFLIHAIFHRRLVAGLIVFSNIVAFALYSVANPDYESRIGMVIGRAYIDDEIRGIEKGKDVLLRLKNEMKAPGETETHIKVFEPVTIQSRGRDLVFVVVRGRDPDEIANFLEKPLARLISEHEAIFTASQENIRQQIQQTQQRLRASEAKRKQEFNRRTMLEARLSDLQSDLFSHEPTRLIQGGDSPTEPISPKLLLYAFVGSFSGLVLGLLVASSRGRRSAGVVQ